MPYDPLCPLCNQSTSLHEPSVSKVHSVGSRRCAIIRLGLSTILDWLQFEGGIIHDARMSAYRDTVELVIEHHDLPEVKHGSALAIIQPIYTSTTAVIRVERSVPPKLSGLEPQTPQWDNRNPTAPRG